MPIEFRRIKDTMGLAFLEPHLLPDEDFNAGELVGQLSVLISHPELKKNLLVLTAWEGKKLVAFGIAMAPAGQKHTFILQTKVWPGYGERGVAAYLLHVCEEWSLQLGRTTIMGETKRNPLAILRRWGFKPYTQIMRHDIPSSRQTPVILEEIPNGKQQQPEEHEHPDPRAAAHRGDAVQPVHQTGARKGKQPGGRRKHGLQGAARRKSRPRNANRP